jgi:crossover junction endodeoxyribonuclease RuvC
MSTIALGVDVGIVGAIAVISVEELGLLEIHDMPVLNDGPARRKAVNAPLLAGIVRASGASRAFCELVAARPGEGAVGAFAFGRSRVIEGVLAAHGLPIQFLTPSTWKKETGIPPGPDGKDLARSEAIRRWPDKSGLFARVKDDGRAEAALIAIAGLLREKRP